MQAHEVMKKQVIKVKEHVSVRSVIEIFIEHCISGLPVVNDRNEIVAYVSDGDIMRFIGNHHEHLVTNFYFMPTIRNNDDEFDARVRRILDLNVMAIAKKTVHKVSWNEKVENIAAILGKKHLKNLPIERDGVLVGIISRGDILRSSFKALL